MFKPTTAESPAEYIQQIDEPRRSQIKQLHQLITKTVPKLKPFMISGMIGYGKYPYKTASGKGGDWCLIGLASQKNYISIYICAVEKGEYIAEKNKSKFPKASIGKSCIRFKKTEDIDLKVLAELLQKATQVDPLSSDALAPKS